ncbi:MAG: membrane protein insertion efficiency factor YidD [Ignavibacteriales bacterium]|nr:membrane protein insertion efficiency factor YidD [Ignavibacteriales bacterium]
MNYELRITEYKVKRKFIINIYLLEVKRTYLILLISVISILTPLNIHSQTDWQRWEPKEISYQLLVPEKADLLFDNTSISNFVLSGARNTYKLFISDLDGDNCPFNPTCSSFFIQAVKETNIFQGALMFGDRFTRDFNIFKRKGFYPLAKNNHFYDPVDNYTLHQEKIRIIPTSEVVNE